jgi:hypothetical protein
MKVATRFLTKFAHLIVATLACYDRVIFKGYLPFGGDKHLNAFIDYELRILRKNFLPLVQQMSQELVDHAQNIAEQARAPYEYKQGKFSKEKWVAPIARERRHREGLLAVLGCQESDRTIKLHYSRRQPCLKFVYRPQRVVYYYFLDPEFGLMHIRIQTWFPFKIQVYVNGHDWLARQMIKRKLGFVQRDNAFTQLDDPEQAQRLADRFFKLRWRNQLNRWAKLVNPHLKRGWLRGKDYYWVIDQAEFATDILFRSPKALTELFPRLLDHATVNFSAQDILTFLGRRLHWRFDGEVITECKKDRWPGARIKHHMKKNWIKMYDKFGLILRIETVINQPREFKVRRWRERKGERQLVWCPMNKGVANFYQYHAAARAANVRYLEALSVVNDPAPAYRQVHKLVQSKRHKKRSYAGFNPARRDHVRFFQAVLRGDHLVNGFRNADIRRLLHGEARAARTRRRQSAAVGRVLKRLHVRGLIKKVPRTRRWNITARGHRLLAAIVQLRYHGLATAA